MDTRPSLNSTDLVADAVAAEDVVVFAEIDDPHSVEQRCAVCGTSESEATELPVGYANPVCGACDRLALEPGGIRPAPDTNPVYVAGAKCWRLYQSGHWVTCRDAYDCDDGETFAERHHVDGEPIHAFNVPQPDGVDVERATYEELAERADALQTLGFEAQSLANSEDVTAEAASALRQEAAAFDLPFAEDLPTPEETSPRHVAEQVNWRVDKLTERRGDGPGPNHWVERYRLCKRYFE